MIPQYHKRHLPVLDKVTSYTTSDILEHKLINNYLYIGGSNESLDWFYSLRAVRKSDLHSGFLDASQQLLKQVNLSQVDFIVGYSLGAAIANIIALNTGIPCIGFATPGISNRYKLPEGSVNYRTRTDLIKITPYGVANLKYVGDNGYLSIKGHSIATYLQS
ncbi:MAG: hypothetical protein ACRDBG_10970 [Waterburya sp.]